MKQEEKEEEEEEEEDEEEEEENQSPKGKIWSPVPLPCLMVSQGQLFM